MDRYELPSGMRYSTLQEREEFYRREFDLGKVAEWFNERMRNVVFAVIIGRHTRIYPPEYEDLADVRDQILAFRPEAVYYDRNIYDEKGQAIGQEMAFDIDPENLTCPVHGTLQEKMKRQQGLGFCEIELGMVKEETSKLYEELSEAFSGLKIVYSGRGFHIHVFDEESFGWGYEKRKRFARKVKKKGFLIDEWVTSGGMRLIRLPHSLHGMVSRVVTPLEIKELGSFDPIRDERCIPRFLRTTSWVSS